MQNTLCCHFAQYCCTRSQYIKLANSHKLNWGWTASDIRQWNHISLSCGSFLHWVYDSGKVQFLSLLLHCITLVVLLSGGANFWDFSLPPKKKDTYVLINGWQLNSSINLPLQSLNSGGGSTISCYEDTGRYIHTYMHTYTCIHTFTYIYMHTYIPIHIYIEGEREKERVKFWWNFAKICRYNS